MSIAPQSRASARADSAPTGQAARLRPAAAAALFGGVVGLAVGCAYLGGTMARAGEARADASRLDAAAMAGFTEEALAAAAGGLDESALAIARRHDPYTVAGGAERDRQAELITARLESLRRPSAAESGLLRRVSLTTPAAQPFSLGSALDASRDLECLTQAAYYEARGEGREGMQAVVQVVLNRVRHPAFPKTVCGVVFQGSGRRTGCQFSFTCDGSMRAPRQLAAWSRARDVAARALNGSVYGHVGTATHFHTTAVSPVWRTSMIQVGQVGQHLFYRFGGRAGGPGAFRYQPQPSNLAAEQPQLVQASLDPTAPVRQAGEAVAYTVLLASDAVAGGETARPDLSPQPQAQPLAEPGRSAATEGEAQVSPPDA